MSLKKMIAGIMAGAMVLGSVMSVSATETTDTGYTALSLDNSIEVDIAYGDSFICTFTPEETDYYSLTSVGNYDVEVYLYDEEGLKNIEEEKGGELNYACGSALMYELTAGETYYYVVRPWEEDDVTVTLTLSKADLELSKVVKDVTLTLYNTSFISALDIELNGSIKIEYADGSSVSYDFEDAIGTMDDFTDEYGNEIYIDYYGGEVGVTEAGLAYEYWARVRVYDATTQATVEDEVELSVSEYVDQEELSLGTALEMTASGYADQWFTFTAPATGDYCFLANVLSTEATLSSVNYYVYSIYYVNADGVACTLYASYNDNGELTYVSDGEASYPVLSLTEGVTYYINALYSDDYDGSSSVLSLTVMYADEVNTSASSTENGTEDANGSSNEGDTSDATDGSTDEDVDGSSNEEDTSDATDGSGTGDDADTSGDSTSSTSDKNTGDVAGNTAAEIAFLLICASGLLVLSRRNIKGMK